MINRSLTIKIKELKDKYPVILVTGPRQSGKTTLTKNIFNNYIYKNLENPDQRTLAQSDPKRFLNLGSGNKMIIDEVQEVPELASYIQTEVDIMKIPGQYVLTGSQNFQISNIVSQSLAGRVANFELLALSYKELSTKYKSLNIDQYMLDGSYPGKYVNNINPTDFYRDYINTYINRDVRSLKNIGNLSNFQKFMQLLAGRIGQLLNISSLASDIGVSGKTIEAWLTVLEASYIAFRLQPYYENLGKRLVKAPKVYFYDTGLACFILGINTMKELKTHYAYGHLFENTIISETQKNLWNRRANEKLFFWRDNHGNEIDLIIDKGLAKTAIEIKSGRTFNIEMLKGLKHFVPIISSKYKIDTKLIYSGDLEQIVLEHNILNWQTFLKNL